MSADLRAADLTQTLGQRVKAIRVRQGIRQIDLAAQAGISWRHLIRIEKDAGGVTKDATIVKLADALGVQRSQLTGDEDDEESSAMPLTRDEFTLLGDLMGRLGATIQRVDA